MSKRVYSVYDIDLQDYDKPVRIYPLTIKKFRRIAEILDVLNNPVTDEDKDKTLIDVLLEGTAYAMETYDPELSDVEKLSEYLDIPTMKYIINVATGITFDDPNQAAAMAVGTN